MRKVLVFRDQLLPVSETFVANQSLRLERYLVAFGKDVTLTGRIPLWLTLIPFIQERLWVGYGFGGFWLGWEGPSAYVWSLVGWDPPHGHNGYLDLWLDLGLVGLGLGLCLLIRFSLRSFRVYLTEGFSVRAAFLVGLITFLIVFNFTESNFLRANNLYWLLFVWGYTRAETGTGGAETCATRGRLKFSLG